MSRSIVTFFASETSFENFLDRLEEIINIRIVENTESDLPLYETKLMGLFLSIYPNEGYKDQRDLTFSNYNYVIDVDPVSSPIDPDLKYVWALDFSKALAILLADDKMRYMITDDVEYVIFRSDRDSAKSK